MASFLCMARSSDLHFCMIHRAEVPLIKCHNSNGVDQIVVPKSSGFRKFLIKKLYVTPLAGHLGVWKLTHACFQRVWWPKLHERVTSFVSLCTPYLKTKDITAVPLGLLQPLSVPESHFSSWSIDFTTNLSVCYECNTIPTCADHL